METTQEFIMAYTQAQLNNDEETINELTLNRPLAEATLKILSSKLFYALPDDPENNYIKGLLSLVHYVVEQLDQELFSGLFAMLSHQYVTTFILPKISQEEQKS